MDHSTRSRWLFAGVAIAANAWAMPFAAGWSSVKPIFDKKCLSCHSKASPQGGLNLQTHAAALRGGNAGKTIVPGKPEESGVIKYLTGTKQPRMPLGGKLSVKEIDSIRTWIRDGARP